MHPWLKRHSFITRPWTPDEGFSPEGITSNKIALIYEACDICTFHPTTGTPLERGGKAIWRTMNVHYDSKAAHSPDSCRLVLSRLFQIAIQNHVDIVS